MQFLDENLICCKGLALPIPYCVLPCLDGSGISYARRTFDSKAAVLVPETHFMTAFPSCGRLYRMLHLFLYKNLQIFYKKIPIDVLINLVRRCSVLI